MTTGEDKSLFYNVGRQNVCVYVQKMGGTRVEGRVPGDRRDRERPVRRGSTRGK